MQCPQSQHENEPQSKFCVDCGARLARKCPSCGIELPAGAKFCNERPPDGLHRGRLRDERRGAAPSGRQSRGWPRISTADRPVSVWMIPTHEEMMIANHTLACIRP